jgi:hypothetical protein
MTTMFFLLRVVLHCHVDNPEIIENYEACEATCIVFSGLDDEEETRSF